MSSKGLIAIVASAAAGLVIALPAYGAPTATTVNVTAGKPSELRFTLSKKTVAKGVVTFKVANRGKLEHDFKIAGKKTAKLKPGKTATLKVDAQEGQSCLPVHASGPCGRRHERALSPSSSTPRAGGRPDGRPPGAGGSTAHPVQRSRERGRVVARHHRPDLPRDPGPGDARAGAIGPARDPRGPGPRALLVGLGAGALRRRRREPDVR